MLCDRFLRALEVLHRHEAPALRAAMAPGYPLHIDATSDKGHGGQFLCPDGWREWYSKTSCCSSGWKHRWRNSQFAAVVISGRRTG